MLLIIKYKVYTIHNILILKIKQSSSFLKNSVAKSLGSVAHTKVCYAGQWPGRVKRLASYKEIEQISKYIEDNGGEVSHC